SASTPNGRIVGGTATNIAVYPHQISLRRKAIISPKNPFSHICGGSIIANDTILTAAHCIIASVPSQYKVVAGTSRRNGGDGVIVSVSEIIMHEEYNPDKYDNDVALLRLSSPLPLNNFTIKAIEITDEDSVAGSISTITGWGTTQSGGTASDQLLAVDVPIVSNEDCNDDYGGGNLITDGMLCAGVRGEGGKDACQGDSGGPLIIDNKLHGVVSWGYGCAAPAYPGVYARVYYFRDWIRSKNSIADLEEQGVMVSKLIYHSAYNKKTHVNDVGLIITKEPLVYSSSVQPIALAVDSPTAGTHGIVSGWGKRTEDDSALPALLRAVQVEIMDLNTCGAQYMTKDYTITDEMICAGADEGGKDACQGDSGGPLTVDGVLVGIVSWGVGCAREGFPGVYTSVKHHTAWIEEQAAP
ncbi:hypothetical protein KR222_009238, partial [Zaprionus bogoriensis]